MIFSYDEEFMNIKIYDDIPDIREGKPKEIIEIPDIMDAWEFYKSVVRCKECKYARNIENEWICEHLSGMVGLNVLVNDDDFCSYGERKESE